MVASHSSGDTPYTSSMASSATDPPSHMSRQLRFSFTSRSFYLPSRYFIYYILISSGSYFSTSLTCITSRSSGHLAPLPFAEGRYATRNVSRCGIIYHTSQCIHNTIHIIFLNSECQILKTNFLSMFALGIGRRNLAGSNHSTRCSGEPGVVEPGRSPQAVQIIIDAPIQAPWPGTGFVYAYNRQ